MSDESVLGGTNGSSDNSNSNVGNGGNAGSGGTSGQSTGGDGKSWRDSLPDEIRANPAISSFKDIESLTKSYIHQASLVGKKGVIPPQWDKATQDELKNFYSQLGVPSADKYDFSNLLPKEIELDEELSGWAKQNFSDLGILPHQAAELIRRDAVRRSEREKKQMAELDTEAQNQIAELKKEWGDGFDTQLASARYVVKQLGEDFAQYLNETGLGNDTKLIRAFAKLSKAFGEDKLREGGVTKTGSTPSEIQSEIDELRSNSAQNGLYDSAHPNHRAATEKLKNLYMKLTGGK